MGWSRTRGFKQLGWTSLPQQIILNSVQLLFKVLHDGAPTELRGAVSSQDDKGIWQMNSYTREGLQGMLIVTRRGWQTRVTRYYNILPDRLRNFVWGKNQSRSKTWKSLFIRHYNRLICSEYP